MGGFFSEKLAAANNHPSWSKTMANLSDCGTLPAAGHAIFITAEVGMLSIENSLAIQEDSV
jgi:hypothetical protein